MSQKNENPDPTYPRPPAPPAPPGVHVVPLGGPLPQSLRDWLTEPVPIDMVLHCPACGMQHVDAREPCPEPGGLCTFGDLPGQPCQCVYGGKVWMNRPHRSHLCHGCGHVWRPADVPTNGVAAVKTKGKNDDPIKGPR
jgi:hypothetical protein